LLVKIDDYTRRGRVWHKLAAAVPGYKLLSGSDLGTALSGPDMRTITCTAEDRQALAHDRYHHPDPRVQRKMEVLWLKSHGLGHDVIAAYADVSRRTVQRYLEEYLQGGLPRLRRCPGPQPQSALAEHRDSLEEHFLEHPPRSAKQAQAVIGSVSQQFRDSLERKRVAAN
jgi:transposase